MADLRHLSPQASEKRRNKVGREAEKKAIELARYVIPIAAFTSMVHTVSGIVLHRLYRMMRTGDTPAENVRVVTEMVDRVRALDPAFFEKVGDGPLEAADVVEARWPAVVGDGDAEAARLDALLGRRTALLVDYSARAQETTADAVRAVFGLGPSALSDADALERLLNPSLNRYRLETLNLAVHSPLGRAMHHASYTFLKRLSHTADSQDQRHRMVPASRPLMILGDTARPDYVTPPLIAANARALDIYAAAMERAWAAKNRLLDMGVPLESALYVLPNAKSLRFYESGSLIYLAHKWVMRTCFNAQEEIYRASMDELEQVRAVHPAAGAVHGPALRHTRRPGDADLHGGRPLLRRPRVAELPRGRAKDLSRSRARPCCPAGAACPVPGREVRSEDLEALTRDAVLCRGLGPLVRRLVAAAARAIRWSRARPSPTASSPSIPRPACCARRRASPCAR